MIFTTYDYDVPRTVLDVPRQLKVKKIIPTSDPTEPIEISMDFLLDLFSRTVGSILQFRPTFHLPEQL